MSFRRLIKTVGALVFGAVVAAGCSSTQTEPPQVPEQVYDSRITDEVRAALASDQERGAFAAIDVDTRDGVVTLSGRVPSPSMRRRAEGIARRTVGVKSVRNELFVE